MEHEQQTDEQPGVAPAAAAAQNTNIQMQVRSIGEISAFDESVETWEVYTERVDLYFLANGVQDNLKVPSLLAVIGAKTYGLLKNIVSPQKPAELTYQQILEHLNNHLNPKPSVIAERFRFHKRDQRPSESIMSYVAELRKLSLHCNLGDNLNDTLRDRFVCGITNEATQKKLLAESVLTFDDAVKIAHAMETAGRDTVELREQRAPSATVHKLGKTGKGPQHVKQNKQSKVPIPQVKVVTKPCWRCCEFHSPTSCLHTNAICHYCSKTGHLERACIKKKKDKARKQGTKVKYVDEQDTDDEDSFEPMLHVHSVNHVNKVDPIMLYPSINGHTLPMELDTGSAVSVIPEHFYRQYLSDFTLEKTKAKLKTYTGERIPPLGTVNVPMKLNKQEGTISLMVVKESGPALFGRDGLLQFKINWPELKVHRVQQTSTDTNSVLQEMLAKHKTVFDKGIGKLKGITAKLYLEDNAQPKFHKARPVPYSLRPRVEDELKRLEDEGIITSVSHSNWASPVVPVVKKSGQVRLCGDYKVSINPVLKVDQYPLPRIQDIFASLAGGKRFSKIDLTQAYNQMEVDESCRELLTINTHKDLYQYNRLQFGVASAPAVWQRAMEQVLQGIPFTSCILDDMIISGKTDNEHLANLGAVLERLERFGLRANLEKCEFFKEQVTYCGHVISEEGLRKSPDKVNAVLNAPKPENVQQLRSFLGLVNYYRSFLPNLSTVLGPLNELLQGDKTWIWTPQCDKAFLDVKEMMTSEQVLCHYDPNRPVKLACDASPYGLGGVLSHIMDDGTERPIAFASRSLTKAEKGYSQIDKEALALYWGVLKFHTYLYGRRFTLVTDHKPLVSILNPNTGIPAMTAARLQRYALYLAGHTYDIEYRNTKQHCNADGLSRLPLTTSVDDYTDTASVYYTSQMEQLPVTSTQIRNETRRDPILSHVLESVTHGQNNLPNEEQFKPYRNRFHELSCHQDCLMWGNRVVVPNSFRERILQDLHEGHSGMVKTKAIARSYVWWPKLDQDIEDLCSSCSGCQKISNMPKAAPVHPWDFPSNPWERLHMDFAGPFLNSMFLLIVDAHSKWLEIYPMKSTTAAKTVEKLRILFSQYGLPKQVVSDNGPQFVAEEFQTFLAQHGIRHVTSAPYHPRSNGQAERAVQIFKNAMKNAENDNSSLQHKLSVFLFKYRTTPHALTNETPAKLLYGRNLRTRLDILKPDLQAKVASGQDHMKLSKHCGTKVRHFKEGQNVMVRDYRAHDRRWIPAEVESQTGPLSYTVNPGFGTTWRRHADQLRTGTCAKEPEVVIPASVIPTSGSEKKSDDVSPQKASMKASPIVPKTPKPTPIVSAQSPEVRRNPRRERRAPKRLDL